MSSPVVGSMLCNFMLLPPSVLMLDGARLRTMSARRIQVTAATAASGLVRYFAVAAWRTAAGPAFDVFRGLGRAVQDARERGGDLARMERLGEQLTDAGGERLLRQERAAIAAHQHDRQIGPMAA